MRSSYVDLDGPVHYLEAPPRAPAEGPPIVLVHGLGGSHANWLGTTAPLAASSKVYVLDLRGFGRTPLFGPGSTIEENQKLLERFLEQVVGEPALLVGNSMGGMLSLFAAARRPELVARLVLVSPAMPRRRLDPVDAVVAALFLVLGTPHLGELVFGHVLRRNDPVRAVAGTLALCCVDPALVPREVREALVALARERRGHDWTVRALLSASRSMRDAFRDRARFERAARAVLAPTLVVHGARDRLVPLHSVERITALRPDWRLEVFDEIGHVPHIEAPARFVETMLSWAREPAAAGEPAPPPVEAAPAR